MTHNPAPPRPAKTPARRGSVLIMVVAALGLLAVIGTVYIVSSRQQRSSAAHTSTAINLDLAQQAVDERVRTTIGNSLLDAAGVLGGFRHHGALGTQSSLTYSMPERGILNGPGNSNANPLLPDNRWLVQNLYCDGYLLDPRYNDLTLLNPNAFNPAISAFDPLHPYYDPATGQPAINTFKVVSEDVDLDDAFVQLLPFSEAGGIRYRFGVRILDSSRMANLNTGKAAYATFDVDPHGTYFNSIALGHPEALHFADAPWALLQGTGRIHRFDLSDELELRSYGTMNTDLALPIASHDWPFTFGNIEPPGSLLSGTYLAGNWRRAFYTAFSATRELRPYILTDDAGSLHQYKAKVNAGHGATLQETVYLPKYEAFTLTQPGYASAHIWPPFPEPVRVNVNSTPDYFFDHSKIPPPPPPPPLDGIIFFGWRPFLVFPRRFPDIRKPAKPGPEPLPFVHNYPDDDGGAAAKVAEGATNLATAMEKFGGYSHEESLAFAANYLATMRNSWWYTINVPHKGESLPTRWLLNGPMFIDDRGICMPPSCTVNYKLDTQVYRPGPFAWGGDDSMDLKAEPGRTYISYSAQPFINEVAVRQKLADHVTPDDDFAVELYNPYNDALNLRGFALQLGSGQVLSLGGNKGKECFVPPRGYFVVTRTGHDLAQTVHPDAVQAASRDLDLSNSRKIYLMREYSKRGAANMQISLAAVDQFDLSDLIDIPVGGNRAEGDHYLRRANDDPPAVRDDPDYLPRWCAAIDDPAVDRIVHRNPPKDPKKPVPPEHMTLGAPNPAPDGGTTSSVRLYDRFLDRHASKNQIFYNISEFNRIPRIAHEIDSATGLPAGGGTVSMQLYQKSKVYAPQVARTQFPFEAGIYFDFRTPPWIYNSDRTAGPDDAREPAALPYFTGDLRAMRFLQCISLVIPPAGTNVLPGQINVNTAPAQVLSMIPVLNNRPDLVSAILAYRWRTTSNDPRIPPDYRNNLYDFTDSIRPNALFPGYGIRSLGELEIPLSLTLAHAPTLDAREELWADVFNLCTVRSDSYIVYTCLEAVRQNPRYTGPFDNFQTWYQTDPHYVTDDPNNTTAPLLRVARRRQVALVDSASNISRTLLNNKGMDPNFTLPKLLAAKDLPR